jgi:hypothetical protein
MARTSYIYFDEMMMMSAYNYTKHKWKRIGGVIVSVHTFSVVGRGFKPWLSQTKDYKAGICMQH